MSNDLLSQQLSLLNRQMSQREPVSDKVDSSALTVSIGMLGTVSSNAASHQFAVSNQQMGLLEEATLNNLGSQNLLLPSKRKASVEHLSNNLSPHQPSIPNKRVAQREPTSNLPGSSRPSAPNKRTVQMQSMPGTPGSQHLTAANKRMIRNDSISKSGSQRVQTPKNRTQQMEPSPKARAESFEAVRSKMRESLAAALALVCQDQDKAPNETGSPPEVPITPREREGEAQRAESSSVHVDTSTGISTNESTGNSVQASKHGGQESHSNGFVPDGDVSFCDSFFVKDELLQGNGLSWAWDMDMVAAEAKEFAAETREFQAIEKPKLVPVDVGGDGGEKAVRSPHDLAFKIEIELFKLYGGVNKKYKEKGRSLMFNLKDRNNPELRERVMSGDITPERLCSMTAEELASKELSEWRVAKAQELAEMIVLPDSDVDVRRLVKKTHKGEYQVEVEQDDGVSVEVSVGTSFTQIRQKDKDKGDHHSSEANETSDKQSAQGQKISLESGDLSLSLTIPADGTDLMQGLIVDELKDAEFLPPIVSLDEFMESLDSEPPFENITVDAGQTEPPSNNDKLETGDDFVAHDPPSKEPVDTKPENAEKTDVSVNLKSSWSPVQRKTSPLAGSSSAAEHVWEGALQLNISAQVTVTGFFRSGEKTLTTDWPTSLEIKGRVRLDAFEKFVQELPMSRSRAVMVAHFVMKDSCSEYDRASFNEMVDSYVSDERLGFAEPAPGVELYFCPTHPKILELLTKHLLKDRTEILNSTDNGLIGIVVWRRPHFSSVISPNSSSHHKHGSKKQQNLIMPRRPQEQDMNANTNLTNPTLPFGQGQRFVNPKTQLDDDDDDDIPPGFGPGNGRDEDDLPEFNFSGNLNSATPKFSSSQGSRITHFQPPQSSPKPVDQMRELIQKYGQTGERGAGAAAGVGIRPWNDDDDDDIPEWDPQAHQKQPQTQPSVHGFHQPIQPHMVNQHLGTAGPVHPIVQAGSPVGVPVQTTVNMAFPQNGSPSWPQGARWVQPSGPHGLQPSSLGSQPSAGQQYGLPVLRAGRPGTDRGRGAPRSRGF